MVMMVICGEVGFSDRQRLPLRFSSLVTMIRVVYLRLSAGLPGYLVGQDVADISRDYVWSTWCVG